MRTSFSWLCLFSLLSVAITTPAQDKRTGVGAYEELVKYYRYYKQDSAAYFLQKGLALARQQKDSNGLASLLIQDGMMDDNQGEFDSARTKYDKALELFTSTGLKKGIAAATIRKGVVELRNGKYDVAIKNFLDALKTSEETGDAFGAMEANYSISWAYLDQKNFPAALKYLQVAEQLNQRLPFSNISLNIYNHFGVIYRETGHSEKAKQYLQRGIDQSNRPEYQGLNITMINNLATVYSKEGQKDKAIALQQQALQRSRAIGNYLRELQTLSGLSKTYGKDEPAKAIFYMEQAVELARSKKIPRQEMRYLKILTDLYKSQNNYKSALATKEREHQLADSFFYKTISQNIEALKAEYELSKSNARIKELDLLNNKNKLELEKSALQRNVTFGGVVLLLIILALLYNQYRIKRRNSRDASQKNLSLQRLLDEKEWLLKEVHHRVKNNLHTITSLLETQSAFLKDDALKAIQQSQHRVYVMSLLHQKLYQGDHVADINMAVYLSELINYLRESYDTNRQLRFSTDIENIELDITQAIPVGLILNEAITNSIKYAFPENRPGEISIRMHRTGNTIGLEIADNGIGIPSNLLDTPKNSLGLKLMKGLSDDLHAQFSLENTKGTIISISFRQDTTIKIVKPISTNTASIS